MMNEILANILKHGNQEMLMKHPPPQFKLIKSLKRDKMVKCERNFLSEKMLKSKKNNCLRSFEIKDFSVKHEKTKNSPLAS